MGRKKRESLIHSGFISHDVWGSGVEGWLRGVMLRVIKWVEIQCSVNVLSWSVSYWTRKPLRSPKMK